MATPPEQQPQQPVTPPPSGHLDEDLDRAKKGWRPGIVEGMYLVVFLLIAWQIVRFYLKN
jgi:hypothetical protein